MENKASCIQHVVDRSDFVIDQVAAEAPNFST